MDNILPLIVRNREEILRRVQVSQDNYNNFSTWGAVHLRQNRQGITASLTGDLEQNGRTMAQCREALHELNLCLQALEENQRIIQTTQGIFDEAAISQLEREVGSERFAELRGFPSRRKSYLTYVDAIKNRHKFVNRNITRRNSIDGRMNEGWRKSPKRRSISTILKDNKHGTRSRHIASFLGKNH